MKYSNREKSEIRGMFVFLVLMITMGLFQTEFVGFLGWETLFVSIYSQCVNFAIPYMAVNLTHLKPGLLQDIFFIGLFLFVDATVEVKTGFPTDALSYILLAAATILAVVSILFLRKFMKNHENPNYSIKRRRVDFIIFLITVLSAFVLALYLCELKYNYFP